MQPLHKIFFNRLTNMRYGLYCTSRGAVFWAIYDEIEDKIKATYQR